MKKENKTKNIFYAILFWILMIFLVQQLYLFWFIDISNLSTGNNILPEINPLTLLAVRFFIVLIICRIGYGLRKYSGLYNQKV